MLKKLLNKIYAEGPDQHLLNALEALADGKQDEATKEVAAYLVAEKALAGPLNWISHPEYVRGEEVQVVDGKIFGEVYYRDETHKIEIEL